MSSLSQPDTTIGGETHAGLPDVTANQHHNQVHAGDHLSAGPDAITNIGLLHSNILDHSNALDHSNTLDHSNALDHTRAHAVDSASDHSAGTLGDILYAAAAGLWTRLAGDTSNARKFLRSLSIAGVAQAPSWDSLIASDYPDFVASGLSHAKGAVPDPGAIAGNTKFLREDAIWASPGASSTDIQSTEVDLGVPLEGPGKHNGTFTLTDAGISASSDIQISLAAGPYTGKGSLADECQMYPGLVFMAVPGSGSATVHWASPKGGAAKGNVKIKYLLG